MSNYQELMAQIATLKKEAESVRLAEREMILKQMREFVILYQLTEQEVFGRRGHGSRSTNGVPKYRDPKTGATWTGRGRNPSWIRGKDRSRYLI